MDDGRFFILGVVAGFERATRNLLYCLYLNAGYLLVKFCYGEHMIQPSYQSQGSA